MENKRVKALQQEQHSSWNKKNLWKPEEDLILKKYVETHGEGNWATVSKRSGLNRSGKSCRLRWKNYLRPNIKRGDMSEEEEDLIIRMHKLLGNRWSLIAGRLPGRTDNEVKNYWNTHLNKNNTGCCPAPESGGLSGRKRKTNNHDNYSDNTHKHQDNCRCSNKTRKTIGGTESTKTESMTREEELKDGINSKEDDPSSSTITSTMTATSYPYWMGDYTSNTDQSLNFDYADIDHQYSPSSSWIQCCLPTITGNIATSSSTFAFDDEPFFAHMDSFLLLEAAFGCTTAAAAAATEGMQSSATMPFSSADDPHSPHYQLFHK